MGFTEQDARACRARIEAYFEAFHRGDSEGYADNWLFPGSIYSDGAWRQVPDRAACVAGNDAYYQHALDAGMVSGAIEALEVTPLGADAALVDGRFTRTRADGSLIARINAAYLVVRAADDWKVAVCVAKNV